MEIDTGYFWSRVEKADPADCWHWKSAKPNSYGRLGARKYDRMYAHRAAWQLTFGAIPDGMYICHHCDNPRCCNPSHLFVGTHADNMRDMREKGRGVLPPHVGNPGFTYPNRKVIDPLTTELPRGERHHWARLNESQVREIKRIWKESKPRQKELAEQFGVSVKAIGHIVSGYRWRHVEI